MIKNNMRKLPLPILLALIIPLFGLSGMFYFAGSLKQEAVERVVAQAENPSGLTLTVSDLEDKIRQLELERVKLQAIIDTFETGYNNGNIKLKNEGVGDLFGNRKYNIDEVRNRMRSINVQLYGHFWETIWPTCTTWDTNDWWQYSLRWDDRKAQAKGVEWAREVESNGWYKEGWYPYEEGAYLKRARVVMEIKRLKSMTDEVSQFTGKEVHLLENGKRVYLPSIGNPQAVRDSSIGAP